MNSITIPQPFSAHGLLYVMSGYVGDAVRPVYAIRPGAQGDISLAEDATSSEFVAWYQDTAGPYHPTPLVYGDYYFTLLDRGFFTVHDARTRRGALLHRAADPAAGGAPARGARHRRLHRPRRGRTTEWSSC